MCIRDSTSYNQTVTATGRLSSSNPNLQNIPIRTERGRAIREVFTVPEGYMLVGADYSQIELRLLAHLSGDEGLTEAFREGKDVHRVTAASPVSYTHLPVRFFAMKCILTIKQGVVQCLTIWQHRYRLLRNY